MTAPAGTYNITADQGATFVRQLTWRDPAGSAIDLTTYTARMQVRPSVDAAGAAVLELTTENGRIALGGTAGTINLTVAATAMAEIPADTFVYDLEMVNGSIVTRLVQGSFNVRGEVTR
jgi:hypothetical protein